MPGTAGVLAPELLLIDRTNWYVGAIGIIDLLKLIIHYLHLVFNAAESFSLVNVRTNL